MESFPHHYLLSCKLNNGNVHGHTLSDWEISSDSWDNEISQLDLVCSQVKDYTGIQKPAVQKYCPSIPCM